MRSVVLMTGNHNLSARVYYVDEYQILRRWASSSTAV
jgi:hypothetical protein